jgi:5-methylcytosine-specific restriction enzyme subunit McrC
VGVVQFEQFEVHVVPKYVGGNLGILRMLDYTRGIDALKRAPAVRELAMEGESLLDLIAMLLAEEATRLVRDGLLDDYITREEDLTTVRGRLLVREQVLRRFGRLDRLDCRFDELDADIPENQLVGAALLAARRCCSQVALREKVARLHSMFAAVCETPEGTDLAFEPMAYHRRNEHYRSAHDYARLLLRQLGVQDLYAPAGTRSFAFLIDMNRLFEDFVTRLVAQALPAAGIRVRSQARSGEIVIDESTGRRYALVVPDLLLERGTGPARVRLPVDAKYKLYDNRDLASGDIYQLFFYAFAFDPPGSLGSGRPARCFILFPSLDGATRIDLRIQTSLGARTARVTALGVSVPDALTAIDRGDERELPFVSALRSAVLEPESGLDAVSAA